MNPAVSVIVPTFNRYDLLIQTVRSILDQRYSDLELILVDDGSSDKTATENWHGMDKRIRYVKLTHTGLPAVARNRGLSEALGGYVAFCDSDDLWLPEKLDRQIRWMKDHKVSFSCTDALVVGKGDTRYLSRYRFRYKNLRTALLDENFVIASSVVAAKNVFTSVKFPEDAFLRGYEDYCCWLSLPRNIPIGFLNEPLLSYRMHKNQLSESNKTRDALVQARIMGRIAGYWIHPVVSIRKIVRLTVSIMRRNLS